MSRRPALLALTALLSLGSPLPGRAAPKRSSAEAGIERGARLMKRGDYEEALREFLDAHDADPTTRSTAQIGLAQQSLGRWVEAEIYLAEALGATEDKWIAKNRSILESCLATVQSHLGKVDVHLEGSQVQGAELRINGEPVGRLPLPRPLTRPVGKVVLEVVAPGFLPFRRDADIEPSKTTRIEAKLEAVPLPPPAPPAPPPPPAAVLVAPHAPLERPHDAWPLSRWAGAGLVASGAAAAVVGIYLLGVDGNCKGEPCLYVRDTKRPGGLWLGTGIGAAAAGAALLVWSYLD